MMRTRLLWFSVGLASASGAITQFIFKDLWIDRTSLASQLKEKFNSLDTRVSNLESSVISNTPTSPQANPQPNNKQNGLLNYAEWTYESIKFPTNVAMHNPSLRQ
ncbi:hypothetical protein BUALT_Bualt14G0016400 [Buddleja alternifolia]|uniref:Uncharacterized protein n=1 Tax=Buddleja alternifolia TaxID=168488 RepID=A0AAV6WFF1_9LAMI|nr:hypothetical protein BUALT_Bualt14G0016400 [Buddleja alternifolia]